MGTFWSAADITVRNGDGVWEAIAAGLVHEVPGKDGGVVLVQAVVDGVAPACHGINVILEELLGVRVCEEGIITLSTCPLNVLRTKTAIEQESVYACD